MESNLNRALLLSLVAAAGDAGAQSSVTISGAIDLSARVVKADGQSRRLSEATDGLNSSELVFKGTEDLGDGLRAGFKLDTQLFPDTGTTATKFFARQSYLTISNRFGEVRLGRDYTPTFWSQAVFDPWGFVGLGGSITSRQLYSGTRQDNSIQYFLPPGLGGFYGQAMVSATEGGTELDRPARYAGGRAGYSAGPLNVALAVAQQRFAAPFGSGTNGVTPVVTAAAGDTMKMINAGASWNFKIVQIMGFYDRVTLNDYRENMGMFGANMPFDQSEVRVSVGRSVLRRGSALPSTAVDHFNLGYVYNLSKRTALYGTVSRLDNRNGTRLALTGAAGPTTAGGRSQGAEAGIRHFF